MRLLALVLLAALAAPALAQPTDGLVPFASDSAFAAYLDAFAERWRPRPAAPPPKASTCGVAVATVSGRVLDAETGEPLIGASVLVSGGAPCGAASGINGQFEFGLDSAAVASGTVTVRALFVGYDAAGADVKVSAGDSATVELALAPNDGSLSEVVVTGAAVAAQRSTTSVSADDAITNNQTAGVDEGGIVKRLGDHLLILRRGRLFTVDIGDGALRPVDAADAFGPLDPGGTWYDELLVVGRTAVVVGYSYGRGGTELVLFDIAEDGQIAYRSTYHLRSNDYYSAENYASRVVEGRLVFYTPLAFSSYRLPDDVGQMLPALRRWQGDAQGAFSPIASATRVFRPARELTERTVALHTVTSCAVADGALDCEATAVLGPFGHTFYVSGTAVYVWLSGAGGVQGRASAMLYRMPLDGGRPSALGVEGGPLDQFSFHEAEGALHVVTSDWGGGQWMWRSERPRRRLSLVRLPLDALGDGSRDAPRAWYRRLPVPEGGVDVNRFVSGHLLYGASRPRDSQGGRVQVVDWRDPGTVQTLRTGHGTERIESLAGHAVVVGAEGGDLYFTAVRLGALPRAAGQFRLADAAQGETRSHGFFYRPDGERSGTLGLPIRRWGGRYASLREGSASVVYLRNRDLRLRLMGALDASGEAPDDACRASCVDWYGNARPLFVGDRVFALLGYEIVEGEAWAGRITEVGRVSFAPRPFQTMR